MLPIFIGTAEAAAIAMVLEDQKFPRPLTLDLMKLVIDSLQARIARVVISELKDDTFLAALVVESNGRIFSFDARPSDSIGLALRAKAPIFVARRVMEAAAQIPAQDEASKLKDLQEQLRSANPEDLGDFRI